MNSNQGCRDYAGFIKRHNLASLPILIASLIVTDTGAEHLSRVDVEALEKQCEAEEAPIFERMRQERLVECQELEKKNRGDPATCEQQIEPVRRGKGVVPIPLLPICEQAITARRHFGLNPK